MLAILFLIIRGDIIHQEEWLLFFHSTGLVGQAARTRKFKRKRMKPMKPPQHMAVALGTHALRT